MTDADLLASLRDCYDPVLRRNVVELNLVRSAHLAPDLDAPGAGIPGVPTKYVATVTLTASNADEGASAHLEAQVSNRLAGLPYVSQVNVTVLPPAFLIINAKVR